MFESLKDPNLESQSTASKKEEEKKGRRESF